MSTRTIPEKLPTDRRSLSASPCACTFLSKELAVFRSPAKAEPLRSLVPCTGISGKYITVELKFSNPSEAALRLALTGLPANGNPPGGSKKILSPQL
jgi:hypothetical protein